MSLARRARARARGKKMTSITQITTHRTFAQIADLDALGERERRSRSTLRTPTDPADRQIIAQSIPDAPRVRNEPRKRKLRQYRLEWPSEKFRDSDSDSAVHEGLFCRGILRL